MYYYSLEKYYKKPETPTLGSPKEYLKKISSVNDVLMTESDVKGPQPKKEKGIEQTRLNKDLFKRIRVMSSDFSEAVETIFSYQLNLNSFTLAALKVVEKLLEKTNKPGASDFTIFDSKVKSPMQAAKPAKSPLEIEINSVIHNVQKMQEELATLVNDIIPPKEKSVARTKASRTPHSEVRLSSPFNKHSESAIALENRVKSQTPSQRPLKFHKPKMKINLQKLYEQDQKENSMTQMSNTNPSYRFLPTNNNSPPMKKPADENTPFSRETRKFPQTSYSKRNAELSHRRMESDSVVLMEVKNESQKYLSLKTGHNTIPKKDLEDDDANSQSCICITENDDVPVLLPHRVKSEKAPSRMHMSNQREDSVGPIRKERAVIKDLIKAQNNTLGNTNLKKTAGGSSNNKRYLIDVRWWISWKEYVNFDSNQTDESKVVIQNYPRPGMIINKDLLNQDHLKQDSLEPSHIDLRDHLLEHHDFIAVSKEIFDTLAGWYSCDYEIMRMMKPHPSHPDKFYLDLFPKRKTKKK